MTNLKKQVEYILENSPEARNSDVYLMLKLWAKYYPSKIHRDDKEVQFVYLRDIMELPREDNIKRIRAVIQNEENRLLPTSLEVVKQRRINEDKWKDYVKNM